MIERTCTQDGCDNTHRARGLCVTHYNQTKPNRHRRFMLKCDSCGVECEKFPSKTIRKRFCSLACRQRWAKDEQEAGRRPPQRLGPKPPTTVKQVRTAHREVQDALERRDYRTVASLIQLLSTVNGECWDWTKRDDSGYGRIGNKPAHRVSLEAHMAAPLGDQPVHHKCANRRCVNPEHLQLVTHYDNMAEMLARNYMTRRIHALEQALREANPSHELLTEVGMPRHPGA